MMAENRRPRRRPSPADHPGRAGEPSSARALLGRAVVNGSVAAVLSTLALAAAAKAERKAAAAPVNATSHWLNGDAAATVDKVNLRHTAVGYATHHAATVFWAALFELRPDRESESAFEVARNAVGMAAIAAAVDYLATPRRFTPGWELVLTKRSMAWTYLALAAGFAIGVGADRRYRATRR